MSLSTEEQEIYNKLVFTKRENELLTVIFEELDELIKTGYDGPFMGEDIRGVTFAYNEYVKWKRNNANKS